VNGPGTQAFGGGLSGTKLVYQRVYKGQSDLRLYDFMAHTYSTVPAGWNTAVWEWSPTISASYVLFGRRNFAIHKQWTILGNLTTGQGIVLGSEGSSGQEIPGQVNGNYAVFTQCVSAGCDVYLHDIAAGTTTKITNTLGGSFQYAPSVTSTGTTYLVHSGSACGQSVELVRVPLGGAETPITPAANGHDIDSTYVDDSAGPTNVPVLYSRGVCNASGFVVKNDIYKVVDP
jgi:Tol biopolymer transport system component